MKKTFYKVFIGLLFATLFVIVSGCDEKRSVETIKEESPKTVSAPNTNKQMATNTVKKKLQKSTPSISKSALTLSDIFEDSAKIEPKNRYMIIIFEADSCPYCKKLNKDIDSNLKLKTELKKNFTVYMLNASKNKIHKLKHEGKLLDVDTKTLVDIYRVDATPTIIFTDKKGKSIFIVPGYMPQKQFLVTLDFVKSGLWLGKNRKNGEVYKILKKYYEKHGIMVNKKKK